MGDQNWQDIRALFGRFFSAADSEGAAEDVRAGERIFDAYPAPVPDAELLDFIKRQIAARLVRRRRFLLACRSLMGAAAVVVVTVIVLLGRVPAPPAAPAVSYAAIIPAAVWESDDVTADDFELMYFNSEIQRIEAQMQALQSGDGEVSPAGSVEDIEMELMQIETEFWKG